MTERLDSPGVRFPPPLLFVAGYLIGAAIDRYVYPWPVAMTSSSRSISEMLGSLLLGAGLMLALWAFTTFRRARTAVIPNQPAARLVRSGPFRYTRNPMYVSLTLAYVGLALFFDEMWALGVLPLVVAALRKLVIAREEAYLLRAFGEAYREYTREVRRWL